MKSEINLTVALDENKIPSKIELVSSDSKSQNPTEVKAFLLSVFEKSTMDTLKIDLWTKEMQISEMDTFMFHTIKAMADTYKRATNNTQMANDMMKFAHYFGEQTQVIPKSDGPSG